MAVKHLIKTRKGAAAHTQRKLRSNRHPALANELSLASLRLQLARAVVMTAASALEHQNADADRDIATVLQKSVADLLFNEIARLEALLKNPSAKGMACSS